MQVNSDRKSEDLRLRSIQAFDPSQFQWLKTRNQTPKPLRERSNYRVVRTATFHTAVVVMIVVALLARGAGLWAKRIYERIRNAAAIARDEAIRLRVRSQTQRFQQLKR